MKVQWGCDGRWLASDKKNSLEFLSFLWDFKEGKTMLQIVKCKKSNRLEANLINLRNFFPFNVSHTHHYNWCKHNDAWFYILESEGYANFTSIRKTFQQDISLFESLGDFHKHQSILRLLNQQSETQKP